MAFESQEQLLQYKICPKPIIRPLEMCESLMAYPSAMHILSRTAQKLCHYEITSIFSQTAFLPSLIPADAPYKYWKNHRRLITKHFHVSIEWLSARFHVRSLGYIGPVVLNIDAKLFRFSIEQLSVTRLLQVT